MLMAVRSFVLVAVVIGAVLVSMVFAIVVTVRIVFVLVFMFVRHIRLSLFGFIQRQASAETPVASRHEPCARKLYSAIAHSSGKVASARLLIKSLHAV
jgi:uncharacterized membrane protein